MVCARESKKRERCRRAGGAWRNTAHLAKGVERRDLEGELARVDGVGGAVGEGDADPVHRVAREPPGLHRLPEPLLDGRDEPGTDCGPDHPVDELEVLGAALRERLDAPDDAPVLPLPAGLLLVEVVEVRRTRDGLPVVAPRLPDLALHLVLALHALHVHLEVQLPHPGDDRLPALGVDGDAERRVLLLEAVQRLAERRAGVARLGGHGEGHDGLRHAHRRHRDVHGPVREGVPGRALDAKERANLPRADRIHVLHVVRMHPHQPRHLHPLPVARVDDVPALAQRPLVNSHIRQLPEAALLQLEGERHERRLGGRLQRQRRLVLVQVQRAARLLRSAWDAGDEGDAGGLVACQRVCVFLREIFCCVAPPSQGSKAARLVRGR